MGVDRPPDVQRPPLTRSERPLRRRAAAARAWPAHAQPLCVPDRAADHTSVTPLRHPRRPATDPVYATHPAGEGAMRLDLIDELQLSVYPSIAGKSARLFDDVPTSDRLDLVASTVSSNGIVGRHYRWHR